MYYKKLVGDDLYLSPIDVNDAPIFAKWFNDCDIAQMYSKGGMPEYFTEQKAREKLEQYIKNNEYRFEVVRLSDDKPIGLFSINEVNMQNRTCRIGGFIGDEQNRGKGYGTQALRMICDMAFFAFGMRTILTRVHSYNTPSLKIVGKVGFKKVGTLKDFIVFNNKFYDHLYFQLMPKDFYKNFTSFYKRGKNFSSHITDLLNRE